MPKDVFFNKIRKERKKGSKGKERKGKEKKRKDSPRSDVHLALALALALSAFLSWRRRLAAIGDALCGVFVSSFAGD